MRFRGRRAKKDLAAALERGHKLLASGQEQQALEFLEDAVQRFPDDGEIRVLYASILLNSRPNDVAAEAAKAAELGSDSPMTQVRAGFLLLNGGEEEAARSCADRANELVQSGFVLMSGLVNLEGLLAVAEECNDVAEEKLRAAVKADPGLSSFAVDLVRFLASTGRRAEALDVLDEALEHARDKTELESLRYDLGG